MPLFVSKSQNLPQGKIYQNTHTNWVELTSEMWEPLIRCWCILEERCEISTDKHIPHTSQRIDLGSTKTKGLARYPTLSVKPSSVLVFYSFKRYHTPKDELTLRDLGGVWSKVYLVVPGACTTTTRMVKCYQTHPCEWRIECKVRSTNSAQSTNEWSECEISTNSRAQIHFYTHVLKFYI